MDDVSSETCLDWLNNMNFKKIVWFIKAISYFVLLRSLGIIIIIIIIINELKMHTHLRYKSLYIS